MRQALDRGAVHAELRDESAEYFLRLVLLLVGVVLALGAWRAHGQGTLGLQLGLSALYLVLVACYLARRRIPPWAQLAVCVLTGCVAGIFTYTAYALFASGAAYLIGACAIGAVLFGRTVGWSLVAGCALALVGPATAWCLAAMPAPFDVRAYFGDPRGWVTAITTFAGIATILILAAGRIAGRLLAIERVEHAGTTRLAAALAERESAERALRAEERLYASAFARSPDAMAIWDLDSARVLEANEAMLALASATPEAVLGRPLPDLAARLGAGHALADVAASVRSAPVIGRAVALGTAMPSDHGCSASAFVAEGASLAMLVLRDLGAQKERERALARLTSALESTVAERTAALGEATRELESFAYSVAHHLRAPLRAMNAQAQILLAERSSALGEQERAAAAAVRDVALDMGNRVDALLELSRINRRETRWETVDLSDLACDLVERLREEAPRPGAEVRIAPGLRAQADPDLLRLVLGELLSNAWKFSAGARPTLIEVGAARRGGADAFYVRDNGVGFDLARAAKLFEPFERMHAPEAFPGAGVGLAAVARAVQRHGGRAWSESAPGHGATFWFTLG